MVEVQGSSHKVFWSPRAEQLAFTSKCLRLFLNLELTKGNLLCDRPRALGNQARADSYSLALLDRIPDCDKKCNIIAVQISRSDAFVEPQIPFSASSTSAPSWHSSKSPARYPSPSLLCGSWGVKFNIQDKTSLILRLNVTFK